MIKANELRIGNCLRYTTDHYIKEERRGKIFRVIPDDIVFLSDTGNVPYVEPIHLTPEILEKCGFILDKEYELKSVADRYFLKITIYGNNENSINNTGLIPEICKNLFERANNLINEKKISISIKISYFEESPKGSEHCKPKFTQSCKH